MKQHRKRLVKQYANGIRYSVRRDARDCRSGFSDDVRNDWRSGVERLASSGKPFTPEFLLKHQIEVLDVPILLALEGVLAGVMGSSAVTESRSRFSGGVFEWLRHEQLPDGYHIDRPIALDVDYKDDFSYLDGTPAKKKLIKTFSWGQLYTVEQEPNAWKTRNHWRGGRVFCLVVPDYPLIDHVLLAKYAIEEFLS